MGFKLAELFVDIKANDSALQTQLGGVKSQLSGMGVAIGTAVGSLAASAIAAASSKLSAFFASGISGALELNDTVSAIGVVFGRSGQIITNEADRMAKSYGVVKSEFLNAASDFGGAFKAIGKSQTEAAELGVKLAKLGMDMKSFGHGVTNEEAFTALRAALRGEFDPLERFNVMLSAAAIESKAMSMGLIKNASDLDESAKKQATLALLLEKTKDQQGDLARTADQSSNSWSNFTGTMTNLSVAIGTALEPAINQVLQQAGAFAHGLTDAFEASKGGLAYFVDYAASVWDTLSNGFMNIAAVVSASVAEIGASINASTSFFSDYAHYFGEMIDAVGYGFRNLPKLINVGVTMIAQQFIDMQAYFDAFVTNAGQIASYISTNWRELIVDGVSAVGSVFENFGKNIANLAVAVADFLAGKGFHFDWTPMLDGFKATAAELPKMVNPAFVSIQDEIDSIWSEIAADEKARFDDLARGAADRAKAAAGPAVNAAKSVAAASDKKDKFKSDTMGVADFATKLRESIYGNPQVAEQKKTNLLLEASNKNLDLIAKRGQTKQYLALK